MTSLRFITKLTLLLAVNFEALTYHAEVVRGANSGFKVGPLQVHELEWVPCDQANAHLAANQVWLPPVPEIKPASYMRLPQQMEAFEHIGNIVTCGLRHFLFYQVSQQTMWAVPLRSKDLKNEDASDAFHNFARSSTQHELAVELEGFMLLSQPAADFAAELQNDIKQAQGKERDKRRQDSELRLKSRARHDENRTDSPARLESQARYEDSPARQQSRSRVKMNRKLKAQNNHAAFVSTETAATSERQRAFATRQAQVPSDASAQTSSGITNDPELSVDASLHLLHEVNAHTWDAEHPPLDSAPAEIWDKWAEAVADKISKTVKVTPEERQEIYDKFDARLGPEVPLFACGSCGTRWGDTDEYSSYVLQRLPTSFHVTKKEQNARDELGILTLMRVIPGATSKHPEVHELVEMGNDALRYETYKVRVRDLFNSTWCNGIEYHLHPELVEVKDEEDGTQTHVVRLCKACGSHTTSADKGPPKHSLAAGVDFGRRETLELPPLSELEQLVLSDVRMYALVWMVVAPSTAKEKEWQRVKLKGHSIAFVQSGLQSFETYVGKSISIEDRVNDLLDKARVFVLGPNGSHDLLLSRLFASNNMEIRPTVVFNYLQVRRITMQLAKLTGMASDSHLIPPTMEEVVKALSRIADGLKSSARRSSDLRIEERASAASDIAQVRDIASDTATPKEVLQMVDKAFAEDDLDFGVNMTDKSEIMHSEHFETEEDSTPTHETVINSHIGVMNAATVTEALIVGTHKAIAATKTDASGTSNNINLEREKEPLSEFLKNGINLMEAFWYEFLLGRGLEKYEGTIPKGATRHLMLHKTNRFQRNKGLTLVLANQTQRHAVLRSVSASVRENKSMEFIELVNNPNFEAEAREAAKKPNSKTARLWLKQVMPLVMIATRSVPFGPVERASCMSDLLSMIRKFGPPSIFLTVAPDDVHNPLSIRLTMETRANNNFPAVPEAYLGTLRESSEDFKRDYLRNEDETNSLEQLLQRQAALHPASTSLLFDRIAKVILEVMCGTPTSEMINKTVPLQKRKKGLFGKGIGSFAVVEETGRGAHHLHMLLWSGALPSLCSGAALHPTAFAALAEALDEQFSCSLPIEVHMLDVARRAMFVSAFRGEYNLVPRVLAESQTNRNEINLDLHRSAYITAAFKQTHVWDGNPDSHDKTCHKPPGGKNACRMGVPFGHPVPETRALNISTVQTSKPGKQYLKARAEKLSIDLQIPIEKAMDKAIQEELPAVEMDKIYQQSTVLSFEDLTCGNANAPASLLCTNRDCCPGPASLNTIFHTGDLWLVPTKAAEEKAEERRMASANLTSHQDTVSGIARLVPMEAHSAAVIEVKRPKLDIGDMTKLKDEAHNITQEVKQRQTCTVESGKKLQQFWQRMLNACPVEVKKELEKQEWKEVKQRLEEMCEANLGEMITGKKELRKACKLVKQMEKMADVWSKLECANSRITCFNISISLLLRCNNNPVLLGSREGSRGACFYLVKYLTKNSVDLQKSLSLLADAKQHIDKYGSTADDKGSSRRTAVHFLQRVGTSHQMELNDTQATSINLNLGAQYCSERMVNVATWAFTREGLLALGQTMSWEENNDENDAGGAMHEADNDEAPILSKCQSESEDEEMQEIGRETQWTRQQKEEANDGSIGPTGTKKTFKDHKGDIIVVDTANHYRLRGPELQHITAHEYAQIIIIVPMTSEESTAALAQAEEDAEATSTEMVEDNDLTSQDEETKQAPMHRGRHPNACFRFHKCHPLYFTHNQRLASKHGCIKHVGTPIPLEPKQLGASATVNRVWLRRRNKFAAYIVALFVPWENGATLEDCKPPPLLPETWLAWRQCLEERANLVAVQAAQEIRKVSPFEAEQQQTIARGRIVAVQQWTHALSVSPMQKQALSQFRTRNRHTWSEIPDDENDEKKRSSARVSNEAAHVDAIVEALRWENQAMAANPAQCKKAADNEDFLEKQLKDIGLTAVPTNHAQCTTAIPSSEVQPNTRDYLAVPSVARQLANCLAAACQLLAGQHTNHLQASHSCPAVSAQARVYAPGWYPGTICVPLKEAAKKAKALRDKLEGIVADDGQEEDIDEEITYATRLTSTQAASIDARDNAPFSHEFDELGNGSKERAEEELQVLVNTWEKQCEAAKEAGHVVSPPPLSIEQRRIGRAVEKTLREIGKAKRKWMSERTTIANGENAREAYMSPWKTERYSMTYPLLFLMDGPAGAGKTEVVKALERVLTSLSVGTRVLTAYTGVAAIQLGNAVTLMTLLKLNPTEISSQSDINVKPNEEAAIKSRFTQYVSPCTLTMLVIDEVSMVSPEFLYHVNKRLQWLLQCNLPFGGLVVLLAGDFYQKTSTMGFSLHAALVISEVDMPNPKTGKPYKQKQELFAKSSIPTVLTAKVKGVALFKAFKRCKLTVTHRFRNDRQHGENLAKMRDYTCEQPVSEELLKSLQPVSEAERDRFRSVKIGVVSNLERTSLNGAKALEYAKHHGLALVRWKIDLVGIAASYLQSNNMLHELYTNEPDMWGYFVYGAPCMLDGFANFVAYGVVNGTQGKLHSLVLQEDTDDLNQLLDLAGPGGIATLSKPPAFVNMTPTVINKSQETLLRENVSLLNGEDDPIVIAIGYPIQTTEFKPISLMAASACIGTKKQRLKKDGTPNKRPSTGLLLRKHAVTLAFATTDYKLQGSTHKELILSLTPRQFEPAIDISSLYVLVSRVTTRNGLRVLQKVVNWDHLRKLRLDPKLEVWEKSYDEYGYFQAPLASAAAQEIAHRIQAKNAVSQTAKAVGKRGTKKGDFAKQRGSQKPRAATSPHDQKRQKRQESLETKKRKRPTLMTQQQHTSMKKLDVSQTKPDLMGCDNDECVQSHCKHQSHEWQNNSCFIDAPLDIWAAAQLWAGSTSQELVLQPPPTETNNLTGPLQIICNFEDPLRSWWEKRHAVFVCPMTEESEVFAAAINDMTEERNNFRKVILKRYIQGNSLQHVESQIQELMKEVGSGLNTLYRLFNDTSHTDFLRISYDPVCPICNHVQPRHTSMGSFAHTIQQNALEQTCYDPFSAFVSQANTSLEDYADKSTCISCGVVNVNMKKLRRLVHGENGGSPPRFLALELPEEDLEQPYNLTQPNSARELFINCELLGSYRLISLLLYDGNHYIAQNLYPDKPNDWIQIDGNRNGGRGQQIAAPYRNLDRWRPMMCFYVHVPC